MSSALVTCRWAVRLVLSGLVALLASGCAGPTPARQAGAPAVAQRVPDDPVKVVSRALEQRLDAMVAAAQAQAQK